MNDRRLAASTLRTALFILGVAAGTLVSTGRADAAATDAQKCLSAKLKAVAKYDLCVLKAQAKAALASTTADTSLCDSKFADKWAKPDAKFGADCPSATAAAIEAEVDEHVQEILDLLGSGSGPLCGNGVIDGSEDCDTANLDGQTCVSQGFTGGTLACNDGCHFDTSACTSATPCDALTQDCEAGQGCYSDGVSDAVCYPAGSKTEGQACTTINECVPGHVCIQQDTTTKCRQVCTAETNDLECPGGQECVPSGAGLGEDAGICF